MVALWTSLAAGVLGLLYLVLAGMLRVLSGRLGLAEPLFVPLLAALALVVPLPFFFAQSFLQLGDLTLASALLALVTGALPLAMLFGLWRRVLRGMQRIGDVLETTAMAAVLQWTLVLAWWGLLPLLLWV